MAKKISKERAQDRFRPNMMLYIVLVFLAITVAIFIDKMHFHFKAIDTRLWMGLESVELTPAIKSQYNIHSENGILVSRTFAGSPAELAGIKEGDIIRRWNGISVTSQEQFQYLIQTADVSKRIKINVDRMDTPVIIYCRVGVRPGGI